MRLFLGRKDLMLWTLILTATGCSSFPPTYPDGMPALVPGTTALEACPQIAGRYSDAGSSFSAEGRNRGPASLTSLYLDLARPLPADVVIVNGPERDTIRLEAFNKGKSIAALELQRLPLEAAAQFRKKGYFCEKGFVRIRDHADFGSFGAAPIGVFSSEGIWLRKAGDGSLIMLHMKRSGGVAFVVPWGGTEVGWYRFPPNSDVETSRPSAVLQEVPEPSCGGDACGSGFRH